MAVLTVRARGKFVSDGNRAGSKVIGLRFPESSYSLLIAMSSSDRNDFIRSAVAEKLARSGALVGDVADRV